MLLYLINYTVCIKIEALFVMANIFFNDNRQHKFFKSSDLYREPAHRPGQPMREDDLQIVQTNSTRELIEDHEVVVT
jgi:hypothetical protein